MQHFFIKLQTSNCGSSISLFKKKFILKTMKLTSRYGEFICIDSRALKIFHRDEWLALIYSISIVWNSTFPHFDRSYPPEHPLNPQKRNRPKREINNEIFSYPRKIHSKCILYLFPFFYKLFQRFETITDNDFVFISFVIIETVAAGRSQINAASFYNDFIQLQKTKKTKIQKCDIVATNFPLAQFGGINVKSVALSTNHWSTSNIVMNFGFSFNNSQSKQPSPPPRIIISLFS